MLSIFNGIIIFAWKNSLLRLVWSIGETYSLCYFVKNLVQWSRRVERKFHWMLEELCLLLTAFINSRILFSRGLLSFIYLFSWNQKVSLLLPFLVLRTRSRATLFCMHKHQEWKNQNTILSTHLFYRSDPSLLMLWWDFHGKHATLLR